MVRGSGSVRMLLAATLVTLAMLGLSGCGSDDADTSGTQSEATDQQSTEGGGDSAATDDAGDAELRGGALDIAQAWFVGPGSDLTADDVEFAVEAMAQDDDGAWWARVSVTPHDDSMETEQIYLELPPGMSLWTFFDSGTGIDPASDERFPEEVRDALSP